MWYGNKERLNPDKILTMTIDINNIIESKGLDQNDLAKELFPGTKHPKMALQRIIKGEAQLDTEQIVRLSAYTGLSISELFGQRDWKASSKGGVHTFESEDYRAELDTNTWISKVWKKSELIHEVVIHDRHISLSNYFSLLNNVIKHGKS